MANPVEAIEHYPNQSQRQEVLDYITAGVPLGGFLHAVATNDLKEAVIRADCHNQMVLVDIVKWFFNHAPINCWGSQGFYERWVRYGGMAGLPQNTNDSVERM